MTMVGAITLEDEDGHLVAHRTYTAHPLLRSPELKFQGIWYRQARREGSVWVYRAVTRAAGTGTDPQLVNALPEDVDG